MKDVFVLILLSSLFTGLIMLILCASDHRLGTKLSPKKRTLAATLTLALQPLMLAVATALSFAQDIFGKVEETITETVTPASTGTTVTDNFAATVTPVTEATASVAQDTTVGVTTSISLPDFGTVLVILAWIWLAGVAVTALYKIVSYLRFTHNLKKSLTKCDIEAKVPVFTSQMAASPFLMGFFRAKIILPEKPMDELELDLAIRHELIHHKRHDIQKKFFAEMLKCLNWFNPAFYVFANKLSELSELTVDEILSSDLDYTGRKAYGGLLLKFASQKQESVLCTDLSKGAKSLAERLELITEDGKRKTTKGEKIALGILSAVTLAVIGVSVAFCMTAVPELEADSREIIYLDETLDPGYIETYKLDEPINPLIGMDYTDCSVYMQIYTDNYQVVTPVLDDYFINTFISYLENAEMDDKPTAGDDSILGGRRCVYTLDTPSGELFLIWFESLESDYIVINDFRYIIDSESYKLFGYLQTGLLQEYIVIEDTTEEEDPETTDLSSGYLVEPPHTLEDGPENPLLDADFTGCQMYINRWVYGVEDEPILLSNEDTDYLIGMFQDMEIDRLPSSNNFSDGYEFSGIYTIVLADGSSYNIGSFSTYSRTVDWVDEHYYGVSINNDCYLMTDYSREMWSEFSKVWEEQYEKDTAVSSICYNEYYYRVTKIFDEERYKSNITELIEMYGVCESEEEYYEILAGIDDIMKYIKQ